MCVTVKLQIDYHNFTNPKAILFSISCQANYINESEIRLEVKLNDNTGNTVNKTNTECSKEIQFNSLESSTTYEVDILWKFDNITLCHVQNDANIFNTATDLNFFFSIIFGMSASMIVLLISVSIFFSIGSYMW